MKITLYAPAILAGIFLLSLCLEGVQSQGRKGPPGGGKGGGKGKGRGRGPPNAGRNATNESETTETLSNGKRVRKVSRQYSFTSSNGVSNESSSSDSQFSNTNVNINEKNQNSKSGNSSASKTGRSAYSQFNLNFGNATMNNMTMMNWTQMMGPGGKKNMSKPKLKSEGNKTAEELMAEFVGLVTEQFVRVGGDGMKQSGLAFKDAGIDALHIIEDVFDIVKGKGKKKKGGKKKGGGKEGGGGKKKKGLLG